MSVPFIGEIRLFPYSRGAPSNWHLCDGSSLPISEYDALYALLGTTYGGDGVATFALPDMRGRVPIHQGSAPGLSSYVLGEQTGTETVMLLAGQMPQHGHPLVVANNPGSSTAVTGNLPATIADHAFYGQAGDGSAAYPLPANTVGASGNNMPHDNCAPTLALNYCIALTGQWPSQN